MQIQSSQILTVAENSVETALEIESNRVLTARLDTCTMGLFCLES